MAISKEEAAVIWNLSNEENTDNRWRWTVNLASERHDFDRLTTVERKLLRPGIGHRIFHRIGEHFSPLEIRTRWASDLRRWTLLIRVMIFDPSASTQIPLHSSDMETTQFLKLINGKPCISLQQWFNETYIYVSNFRSTSIINDLEQEQCGSISNQDMKMTSWEYSVERISVGHSDWFVLN